MGQQHIHYNVEQWRNRVEFCERHLPTFRKISHQDDNFGEFRVEMFTVLTQHIHANSVTDLIDIGLAIERKQKDSNG